jgi:hypothetical protein
MLEPSADWWPEEWPEDEDPFAGFSEDEISLFATEPGYQA